MRWSFSLIVISLPAVIYFIVPIILQVDFLELVII